MCCFTLPSSLPPKHHLHNSSKTSQPTVTKSIWQNQNFPKAGSPCKLWKNILPPSPCPPIQLEVVSTGSVPRHWTDASCPESQPPLLSSTCWRYNSWAALSFWPTASRRIPFASGWLGLCPQHHPYPTNLCSHHLHCLHHRKSLIMGANGQSLQHLFCIVLQPVEIGLLGSLWGVSQIHQEVVLGEHWWRMSAKWMYCFQVVMEALKLHLEMTAHAVGIA